MGDEQRAGDGEATAASYSAIEATLEELVPGAEVFGISGGSAIAAIHCRSRRRLRRLW